MWRPPHGSRVARQTSGIEIFDIPSNILLGATWFEARSDEASFLLIAGIDTFLQELEECQYRCRLVPGQVTSPTTKNQNRFIFFGFSINNACNGFGSTARKPILPPFDGTRALSSRQRKRNFTMILFLNVFFVRFMALLGRNTDFFCHYCYHYKQLQRQPVGHNRRPSLASRTGPFLIDWKSLRGPNKRDNRVTQSPGPGKTNQVIHTLSHLFYL